MAEVTYCGLTHTCDEPECHLPGFVATLRRMEQERRAPTGVLWDEAVPLTVGDLRRVIGDLPDDAQVFVDGNPDRPVVGALTSQQIPHERLAEWERGDPLTTGLELWLGGDDEFPAPRCNHSERPPVEATS